MELNQYLRSVVHQKIRPLFVKEKCEICDDEDNLHLHHVRYFYIIVSESLQELNLNRKDTKDYTSSELSLISDVVLGKHLSIDYLTLCDDCHIKAHENERKEVSCNEPYYRKEKIKKEEYFQKTLEPYLKSIVGKWLFKEEKEDLIVKIDARSNGKQQRSYRKLNEELEYLQSEYIILPRRVNRKVDGSLLSSRFWEVAIREDYNHTSDENKENTNKA